METERPSPRYSTIDLWRPADILDAMLEGQFAAVAAVHAARPALERAALAVEERLRGGGRLVYAGAGTSGRLAVQDGAELMPTFGWPGSRLVLLMAGGRDALLRAVEGAEDEAEEAAALVEQHAIAERDALIAVAASGTTPFTVGCLREAASRGALTVGIANNPNTPILDESDHPVRLDTGAEPIAGSTRMKAGTAQRVALTLLSSLVMIRLGHVYQGLMVDVQATNSKLVRRSERMLAQLTGRGADSVREALREADGSVKLALLLLEGIGIDEARAALDRGGGDLRAAKELVESGRNQEEAGMSMAIRNRLALALLLPGILLAVPAGAAEPWFKLPDNVARRPASLDPDILKQQVLLDRAGFSPGVIDGRKGENVEHARHAFQKENGLKVGTLDQETRNKLTRDIRRRGVAGVHDPERGRCRTVCRQDPPENRGKGETRPPRLSKPERGARRKIPHERGVACGAEPGQGFRQGRNNDNRRRRQRNARQSKARVARLVEREQRIEPAAARERQAGPGQEGRPRRRRYEGKSRPRLRLRQPADRLLSGFPRQQGAPGAERARIRSRGSRSSRAIPSTRNTNGSKPTGR